MSVRYKCTICETHTHFTFQCFNKPKKAIRATQKPLKRSPIKKTGKHAKKWQSTRTQWLKQNKGEWFTCYLCNKMVSRRSMHLDHVEARSRRPDLRYEMSNIKPVHARCNLDKGSLSVEQYKNLQNELRSI